MDADNINPKTGLAGDFIGVYRRLNLFLGFSDTFYYVHYSPIPSAFIGGY
jgi:hypothetical protein